MFVRPFVTPCYYGSGTVINYGSDVLTSCGFKSSGSGSTQQKFTVPTVPVPVPVPKHCPQVFFNSMLHKPIFICPGSCL